MNRPSGKRWRPFRFLAEAWVWGACLPTRRGIAFALAGIVVIPAASLALGGGWLAFWMYNMVLALFAIADLAMLPSPRLIRVVRTVPDRVEQRQPFQVTVMVQQGGGMPVKLALADDLPLEFREPGPMQAELGSTAHTFTYETEGAVRGDFLLRYVYVRYSGWLGLWSRQARLPQAHTLRVFPDLSGARGIMASMKHTLILDGQRIVRKERSGPEFDYIRDYAPDDDPRSINWTATARAGKAMANVRRPERGKIVTLLVDCGRLMSVELDGRVKLDRTLEAALSLAAVALKQGDQVAVLAFSGTIWTYIPPGGHMEHLQRIVTAVYALKCDGAESNYSLALDYVLRVQRKRSMLVLFSDLDNYLFEDELAPYLLKLRRSHSILLLSLEDPVVAAWTRAEALTLSQAHIRSAAQSARLDRKRFAVRLGSMGITALDVPAEQLAVTAVNQYLKLRARDWS